MATTSLPTTIKAVLQPDPKSNHLILTTTPLPKLSDPQDYLIQVKAVCPCLDELTWEVKFPQLFTSSRERVPCTECAGVVVDGPADGPFKPGDEVFYRNDAWHTGTLREYSVVGTPYLALKPKTLSWTDAAATPLSALTAWQGLFEHGTLDKAAVHGDAAARKKNAKIRVLITGASGAVGGWAVQLATAAGAGAIVGVGSPSKASDMRQLGATELVDYTTQSVDKWAAENPAAREVDLILDCVGGPSMGNCWGAIKNGGTFLSVVGQPGASKPEGETKTLAKGEWFLVQPRGSDLAEIAQLVDAGKCKPLVDSVLPFEKFAEAFAKVESRKTNGKVVISVSN
ncbi:hypothetical protein G7Z17_g10318 [Cylindrodendrum hubeiense]|uniref:Enoyl reductase (ER) domain-containing protein n=1 Tax=Cylindrodendrum hubeiense TaxID=595255 RepID=A0A9P5H7E0_9HYPO|nr:hypothetical protein G7Z17_g10318 [Cylindrodendrum hubeiense]